MFYVIKYRYFDKNSSRFFTLFSRGYVVDGLEFSEVLNNIIEKAASIDFIRYNGVDYDISTALEIH